MKMNSYRVRFIGKGWASCGLNVSAETPEEAIEIVASIGGVKKSNAIPDPEIIVTYKCSYEFTPPA